ncbi:Hypothetical protein BN2458_PEG0666 [Helicobacter typhlonius]|uniref:Uncharacterized protein n=1 Tax=Helicobacter typhlonius TaxID=76936 RepID=A0A0S4PW41_9HELI|nr:Hypothetical protein BN2458_PEG0207 [Helicobacter typhlonius]CUU39552.1 Hypothetical protein BN2458_PEG0666 [Helicobacter typhlonius]
MQSLRTFLLLLNSLFLSLQALSLALNFFVSHHHTIAYIKLNMKDKSLDSITS